MARRGWNMPPHTWEKRAHDPLLRDILAQFCVISRRESKKSDEAQGRSTTALRLDAALASTTPIRRAAALSWRLTWQFETRQLRSLPANHGDLCLFSLSLTGACMRSKNHGPFWGTQFGLSCGGRGRNLDSHRKPVQTSDNVPHGRAT